MAVEFLPLGDRGVRIAFGDTIRLSINRRIRRFGQALEENPINGVTEWVSGYTTVSVYYQPWVISYDRLCRELKRLARTLVPSTELVGRLREIPVCYGGAFGPDLEYVAAAHRLTPAQVIQRHRRPLYRVYFLGFLPGFAYLGGLSATLTTPRKAVPRAVIPAGSLGIAGEQTGVYPMDSPGGWQIIGRTPFSLFDPTRQPPALLSAGDCVRFRSIAQEEFEELRDTSP